MSKLRCAKNSISNITLCTYFKPLDSIVLSVMSGLGDRVENGLVSREVSLDVLSIESDIRLSGGLSHLSV